MPSEHGRMTGNGELAEWLKGYLRIVSGGREVIDRCECT
tara:strand:- start:42 stop:158 length:117 start_codon:yes stop_codon:yes gene_type:complete